MDTHFSMENYILKLIQKRKRDIEKLYKEKDDYTSHDYEILFHRYNASIGDLYMCLTAWNNPLSQLGVNNV